MPAAEPEKPDEPSIMEVEEEKKQVSYHLGPSPVTYSGTRVNLRMSEMPPQL